MGLKPYLQLVRLPNLFTAAADPLAGFLIVGGSLSDSKRWLPLVLAGVSIYAAGMVLNDVFDYQIDFRERPKRPLPSGLISRRVATVLGISLLTVGGCLTAWVSLMSLIVGLALLSCVLAYDAGLKHTWLGPEVMGACRSLNLLLGMSLTPTMGGPPGWLAALLFGLFVAGITWISRNEVHSGRTPTLALGLALQYVSLLGGLVALGMKASSGREYLLGSLVGLVVLAIVGREVLKAGRIAWVSPIPETLQIAVKTGVFSLVWLDVCLVSATRGPFIAMTIAALWIPAFRLGKWLYST